MSISISHDDEPIPHKSFLFSGGEVQVRILREDIGGLNITIRANLYNSQDIMEMMLGASALKQMGALSVDLVCPYLPYARQDRVCSPGEAFSLAVMANMVNACGFYSVEVWDVHSDVALALLDKVQNREAYEFVSEIPLSGSEVVVAPDKGGVNRASLCAAEIRAPLIQAHKNRDPDTGRITHTEVPCEHLGDRDVLIVDDICDGGRTFIELAKVLRSRTRGKIKLYVTHGIFSQGDEVFSGLIDQIYTANLFPNTKSVKSIIQV